VSFRYLNVSLDIYMLGFLDIYMICLVVICMMGFLDIYMICFFDIYDGCLGYM